MRLKLGVQYPDKETFDLSVTVDAQATIGDLADFLANSRPGARLEPNGKFTIALASNAADPLLRDEMVVDSGIRSGTLITITRTQSAHIKPQTTVATLHVIEGVDTGKRFPLKAGTNVIGRSPSSDVRLSDVVASRRHAQLRIGTQMTISDLGSANGIMVRGAMVDSSPVEDNDPITIGDSVVVITRAASSSSLLHTPLDRGFNRPPVLFPGIEKQEFKVPVLPTKQRAQTIPILTLIAPVIMGVILYLATRSTITLMFMALSPIMMVGNTIQTRITVKRQYREDLEKFRSDIEKLCQELTTATMEEQQLRCLEQPTNLDCIEAVKSRSPLFWSRREDLDNFGKTCIGFGARPSYHRLDYPLKTSDDKELISEARAKLDHLLTVAPVPVQADFSLNGALGFSGPIELARSAARSHVLQLVSLHSYADLSVATICGKRAMDQWDWLKWLPHCGGSTACIPSGMLASDPMDQGHLVGQIQALVSARNDSRSNGVLANRNKLLVLVDDPDPSVRSRLVEVAEEGGGQGIWVLWIAENTQMLPAACKSFIEVVRHDSCVANWVDGAERIDLSSIETADLIQAESIARALSSVVDSNLTSEDVEGDVPNAVSFLDLVGRDVAESSESVIERWIENRSILTGPRAPEGSPTGHDGNLRAMIGQGPNGPHTLDLRVHGPHALVGGTTGAGKSELLQSWIVGMALYNSPQRLTFLLIDYKGGSAFSDCVNLPHTVGLVTDLSPYLVRRALTSLSAELTYREHVLQSKGAKDLATLEREGDPDAPPSLVIVVDEFAALVKEVPEFVDGVVNVAQRGRSLGLHLILATQRPAGVIKDNLRANTNLRIALRMADSADSSDVLGSKIAATFDPEIPGRAASRTGPAALLSFQTAYIGGRSVADPPASIAVNTLSFEPVLTWKLSVTQNSEQANDGPTDIARTIKSMGDAAHEAGMAEPRKPWLPELASVYDLSKLPLPRRDDQLVFAVADDPMSQSQSPVAFHPDSDGNLAIYGAGNSGKSTFLRSLAAIAGATSHGGPVNVYAVDFGARGLEMLNHLPHVGGVISSDDHERVGRLFNQLLDTIEERADRFSRAGAGNIVEYRRLSGDQTIPRILLLIDGMGSMREEYEGTDQQKLFNAFQSIMAEGRMVGINVVVSADRAAAIPNSLNAQIQARIVLRLASENDYSVFGMPRDILSAKSPPGRGLYNGAEIQIGLFGGRTDLMSQDRAFLAYGQALREQGTPDAPTIKTLGERIDLESLPAAIDDSPVIGVLGETLAPCGIPTNGTFVVAGPPESGKTACLVTMTKAFQRALPTTRTCFIGSRRSPVLASAAFDVAVSTLEDIETVATQLVDTVRPDAEQPEPWLIIVEDLAQYAQSSAETALDKMIRTMSANGSLVVSEGEATSLNGMGKLLQSARAGRRGIVLQPDPIDGALFRVQFGRLKKTDFPPGRGFIVDRAGTPHLVQVAFPETSEEAPVPT